MFLGEYQHSLDSKGRLAIPAKLREELGAGFVITKGLDNCLYIYPQEQWQKECAKLASLPTSKKAARDYARFFFSSASEAECDRQGRVLLPPSLRRYASLNKDTVIVGAGSRAEIWDAEAWQKYNEASSAAVNAIAEELSDLGI